MLGGAVGLAADRQIGRVDPGAVQRVRQLEPADVELEPGLRRLQHQHKIDLVSRLGGNWYSRSADGLFEVEKPLTTLGIGVDAIPEFIKNSPVFDGNDLGKLGNVETLPTEEEVTIFVKESFEVKGVLSADDENKKLLKAKEYLDNNEVTAAWKVLLAKKDF